MVTHLALSQPVLLFDAWDDFERDGALRLRLGQERQEDPEQDNRVDVWEEEIRGNRKAQG